MALSIYASTPPEAHKLYNRCGIWCCSGRPQQLTSYYLKKNADSKNNEVCLLLGFDIFEIKFPSQLKIRLCTAVPSVF